MKLVFSTEDSKKIAEILGEDFFIEQKRLQRVTKIRFFTLIFALCIMLMLVAFYSGLIPVL